MSNDDQHSITSFIKRMSPQLAVADMQRSITFYGEKLGFTLEFQYKDFYAAILRDSYSIHLKSGDAPGNDAKNSDALKIIFSVDKVEQLYKDLVGKSVEIVQPLREMPYGKEFYIADPDGNRLGFVE